MYKLGTSSSVKNCGKAVMMASILKHAKDRKMALSKKAFHTILTDKFL